MKRINILLVFLVWAVACKGQENKPNVTDKEDNAMQYVFFGDKIDPAAPISETEMAEKYQNLALADTLRTKFRATVTDVCKAKGCWMKLQLKDGQETMVRFKDYGFFVPMDITGKEVIVNGLAFVESMSVEDQKHYAKDGGRPEAEIAKITEPKKTYGFEADGVILVKN